MKMAIAPVVFQDIMSLLENAFLLLSEHQISIALNMVILILQVNGGVNGLLAVEKYANAVYKVTI